MSSGPPRIFDSCAYRCCYGDVAKRNSVTSCIGLSGVTSAEGNSGWVGASGYFSGSMLLALWLPYWGAALPVGVLVVLSVSNWGPLGVGRLSTVGLSVVPR